MSVNHVLECGIKNYFHSFIVMAIVKVFGHIGECDIPVGVFVNTVFHLSLFNSFSFPVIIIS